MADENSILRRIEVADKFRAWLETPEVDTYFTTVREQIVTAMLKTKDGDDMGRYRLKVAVGVLEKFREFLAAGIADGEIAKKDLEELRSGRRPFF